MKIKNKKTLKNKVAKKAEGGWGNAYVDKTPNMNSGAAVGQGLGLASSALNSGLQFSKDYKQTQPSVVNAVGDSAKGIASTVGGPWAAGFIAAGSALGKGFETGANKAYRNIEEGKGNKSVNQAGADTMNFFQGMSDPLANINDIVQAKKAGDLTTGQAIGLGLNHLAFGPGLSQVITKRAMQKGQQSRLMDPIQKENMNFPTSNPNLPEDQPTPIMKDGGYGVNKSSQNHLLEKYKLLPHSQLSPNLANAHLDGKPIQLEKNETVFKMANGGSFAFSPNLKTKDGVTYADKSIELEKAHSKPFYDKVSENTLKYNLQNLADENQAKIDKKQQNKIPKANQGMSASELGNESLNDDGVARNWMWNNIIQNENSYDPYGYRKTTNIGFQQRPSDNINVEKFDSNLSQNNVQLGNFSRVEGPNTKQLRNSINWDNKKTQVNNNLTTGDYLQLAGQIPALAYNTGMAFRKPEKQKLYQDLSPITPNQQSIDLNPMFLAQNNAFKTVNEGTTSDAVRRANLANITSGTQRNMADALLQNKNLNASLRGQFEQRLADRSRFNIAQKLGVDDINAKNRAAQRMFGATAATNLGQGLTNFGLAKNQGKTNEIQYSTLQSLASNYGLDPKEYADFLKSKGIKIKYK